MRTEESICREQVSGGNFGQRVERVDLVEARAKEPQAT
jgi:hypothetical protein